MKTRTNVSIDSELLESARKQGIVISQLLEEALRKRLKEQAQRDWEKENSSEIRAYNEYIDEHGVFSDGERLF